MSILASFFPPEMATSLFEAEVISLRSGSPEQVVKRQGKNVKYWDNLDTSTHT